ncbi:wall-associated receptor kinase 3-like isoform X2 [Carya illinoinensis]|uniref:wall-associated receptor kinase 3-like isoform X2 n=1 Tax=Carya illinoinensis TaxID=32201 RepID=UPI001C721BD4|nr:wall-associated receptor kinase 3-like isoform X2 [Carya illinoinensis]
MQFCFVAREDKFKFSSNDLEKMPAPDIYDTFPMVLDWAIGNETCETARSKPDYVCGQNSSCYDSQNGDGYRCKCNKGYEGNPYLHEGCQDINECLQVPKGPKPCNATAICTNTDGSFTCTCPYDYVGDGQMNGTGCSPKASGHAKIIIAKVDRICIKRKVVERPWCSICETLEEIAIHALWSCSAASDIWGDNNSPLKKWYSTFFYVWELWQNLSTNLKLGDLEYVVIVIRYMD